MALCGATAPTVTNAPPEGRPSVAVQLPIGADEPSNSAAAIAANAQPYGFDIQNHALSLSIDQFSIGRINASLYHQARSAVTASFTFTRSTQNPGPAIGFGFNDLQQSRTGLRATIESNPNWLGSGGEVVWGGDAETQDFSQPNSLGTIATSPDYKQSTTAVFAQFEKQLGSALKLSGGARYEIIRINIPTFFTPFGAAVVSHKVDGGTLKFNKPLLNFGAVYDINTNAQVFGSYAQGISVGELLRAIRNTNKTSVLAGINDIQPVKVDALEIGLRGFSQPLNWSFAAFINKSPLGATITRDPTTQVISSIRAPETVFGFEATADFKASAALSLGGILGLQKGKRNLNGVTEALPGTRIAPLKATAYLKHSWGKDWYVQGDVVYTGKRNEFPNGAVNPVFSANVVGGDAEGAGRVQPVTLINLSYTQPVGMGQLSFSVINLSNSQYIATTLQALNDPRAYYAGQGRAFGLSYRVLW